MTRLTCSIDTWPLATSFNISRGAKTQAHTVTATLADGTFTGQGECVPYPRYGESVEGVMETILSLKADIEAGMTREELQLALPPGAARNALDCAFWDLEAKKTGERIYTRLKLPTPAPITTAFSLSLDTPEKMAIAATAAKDRPLLKVKLGGEGNEARIRAIRAAAPHAQLIIDANEGWTKHNLAENVGAMAAFGVSLIEQPLPADDHEALRDFESPIPLCADEACHGIASLAPLIGLYDAVNIKLDKTGGLTEALAMARAARDMGFGIMIGCMIGTSLGMAPAMLLAQPGDIVDLDGPLWLKQDRANAITYQGSQMLFPTAKLWG
ncbi:MAG: N-acetyl-D-Glu racemase DgcA [Parvibaculum sp.]